MIELECCSLSVILLFEETFEAATSLDSLRATSGVCGLSQYRMEVRLCVCLLRVTLFLMLMSGKVLAREVRSHVIKLSAGTFSSHR